MYEQRNLAGPSELRNLPRQSRDSRLKPAVRDGDGRARTAQKPDLPEPPANLEQLLPEMAEPDAGNEAPQNVVGAFADHVDPRVAHHAFEGLVGEVSGAAVDLERVVDDRPERVAGEHLE